MKNEHDFKAALDDVNRWAKHIVRGGKNAVDIMAIEPETLKAIQAALRIAHRVQSGDGKYIRGQVWKNPDDLIMFVVRVSDRQNAQKVEYITEEGERGSFYSTELWLKSATLVSQPMSAQLIKEVCDE